MFYPITHKAQSNIPMVNCYMLASNPLSSTNLPSIPPSSTPNLLTCLQRVLLISVLISGLNCKRGWPWTCNHLLASASRVLRLESPHLALGNTVCSFSKLFYPFLGSPLCPSLENQLEYCLETHWVLPVLALFWTRHLFSIRGKITDT